MAVRLGRSTKVIITLDQFHLRCTRKVMRISAQSQHVRHWGTHHESTAAVDWTCGSDGWHAPPEDGLLLWAGHCCAQQRTPSKEVQRDGLKASFGLCGIATLGWEAFAPPPPPPLADPSAWHGGWPSKMAFKALKKRAARSRPEEIGLQGRGPDPSAAVAYPQCACMCESNFGHLFSVADVFITHSGPP